MLKIKSLLVSFLLIWSHVSCRLTEMQVQELQDAALQSDHVKAEPLFTEKNFRYHTPDLFAKCDETRSHEIFIKIYENELFPYITNEDVRSFPPIMGSVLYPHIRLLGRKLRFMSIPCFKTFAPLVDPRDIKYLPVEMLRSYPGNFAMAFRFINTYSVEQLREITYRPKLCRHFDYKSLEFLTTKEQFKALNPRCLSWIPEIEKADLRKALDAGLIPGDFFHNFCGQLKTEVYSSFKPDHVKYFGLDCHDNEKMFVLPVAQLPFSSLKGMTPIMFSQWVLRSEKIDNIRWAWKHFRQDVLNDLVGYNHYSKLVERLDPKNYWYMMPWQLNKIMENPEICSLIPPTAIFSSRTLPKLDISSRCFSNLPPEVQSHIIGSDVNLQDNLMEYMSAEHVCQMKHSIYGLNLMKMRNRGAILENLGTKVNPRRHICRLISSVDVLKNMTIFRHEKMPKGCWNNMGFKVSLKDVLREPKLFAGRPKVLKSILRNERNLSRVARLSKADFERLTGGKAGYECKHMRMDQYLTLKRSYKAGLNPICIANLPFLDQLSSDDYRDFTPNALSHIGKDEVKNVYLALVLNSQLENLSSGLDLSESAGHAMTKDVLENQIMPFRLNHLPARLWNTIPTRAFTIFRSPEILAPIAGEKMVYWRLDQVLMIPKEVLATMNQDQADSIGSLFKDKDALARYLKTIKFAPEIKTILADRFDGFDNLPSMEQSENVALAEAEPIVVQPPKKRKSNKFMKYLIYVSLAIFSVACFILLGFIIRSFARKKMQ